MLQRGLLDGDDGRPSSWPSESPSLSSSSASSFTFSSLCSPRPSSVSSRTVTLLTLLLAISLLTLCVLIGLLASVHTASSAPAPSAVPSSTGSALPSDPALAFALRLSLPSLLPHLHRFQLIANSSSGSRVISGLGFNRSVDYVLSQLSSTGLIVRREFFPVERYSIAASALTAYPPSSPPLHWTYNQDYTVVTNSGGRGGLDAVNATVTRVPFYGCNESDWTSSVAGRIALVAQGTGSGCTLMRQAQLAVTAGAAGVVVYTAVSGSIQTTATVAAYTAIPIFLVTWDVGVALMVGSEGGEGMLVRMAVTLGSTAPVVVTNVIADTPVGDEGSTVVVGTHLDGVAAGAGINDNASGSSANLAFALEVSRLISSGQWSPPNRIRFIWFGAEENGLFGSRYHVGQASRHDRPPGDRITDYAAMLNYDSIASPNGFYAVYDASELPSATPVRAVNGSRVISGLHYAYFTSQGLPSEATGMGGGSDYVGFLESGIACGGLYGGLTEVKTRALRDRYDAALGSGRGGVANAALDPCYHRDCDDEQNVNQPQHLDMARAAAYAVASMALHPHLRDFLQYPPS